jgi:hypothetical protein
VARLKAIKGVVDFMTNIIEPHADPPDLKLKS